MSQIPWRVVKYAFQAKDFSYAITLNPKPGLDLEEVYSRFVKYLKEHYVTHWLVKCKSDAGYIHWHGMIHFAVVSDIEKQKKALRNKINREIGRFPSDCLVRPEFLKGWYQYVYGASNITLAQDIYHSQYYINNVNKEARNVLPSEEGEDLTVSSPDSGEETYLVEQYRKGLEIVENYD